MLVLHVSVRVEVFNRSIETERVLLQAPVLENEEIALGDRNLDIILDDSDPNVPK